MRCSHPYIAPPPPRGRHNLKDGPPQSYGGACRPAVAWQRPRINGRATFSPADSGKLSSAANMRVDLRKWAAAESSFMADSGHPGATLDSPYAFQLTKGNEGALNGPRFWG